MPTSLAQGVGCRLYSSRICRRLSWFSYPREVSRALGQATVSSPLIYLVASMAFQGSGVPKSLNPNPQTLDRISELWACFQARLMIRLLDIPPFEDLLQYLRNYTGGA